MKFTVDRTDGNWDKPPVEGAVKDGKKWSDEDRWTVEIGTLAELMELSRKEDCSLIINTDDSGECYIEVYDGYRE